MLRTHQFREFHVFVHVCWFPFQISTSTIVVALKSGVRKEGVISCDANGREDTLYA